MKHILWLLAALLLGAILFAPPPGDAAAAHTAIVGDSYSVGPAAWPWRTGVRVDVAAQPFAGYVQPGDRGDVFSTLAAQAVQNDTTLVLFFGSRNDRDAPPGAISAAATGAYNTVRRTAPNARLVVIGPLWPTGDVPADILAVRDALAGAAAAAGALFVDPISEGWFADNPQLTGPDGVHPSAAGQAWLAARITPLLR